MQFYLRSAEAWVAILQECNAAQHSIQIEQYIIWDDEIGHMLLNVLTEKAKQQLKVQLILDDFGGRTINSSPALDALQAADGEVKFNRPLWWHNLFFPSTWFPRDHCKNIIIDGKAAYIGGICFAKHMQDWRDTQVRFEGQLAETVQQDFESCWDNLAYGTTSHSQMTAAQGHNSAEYVIQEPYEGKLNLYDAMLREIAKAQTYIHIVTPYFFLRADCALRYVRPQSAESALSL
ncbi:MAG: hypothetical protein GC137_07495 [Alphaproteobacteria bacterium]|nr:hypothetical protein [Alphaproteobacteria bacterium]